MLPSDFVALGRPKGITGSNVTQSPNDLVAVAYQRVFVGSDTTKAPSDIVALGRPRGITGSNLTQSPNDLVAVAYQRVFVGSDATKAPSDIKTNVKG